MKKLIALLISALMILSMAAFAETAEDTALIARISNIALEYSAEGQAQNVNLDGFEAYLTLDTADGIRLVGQAFNGEVSSGKSANEGGWSQGSGVPGPVRGAPPVDTSQGTEDLMRDSF